MQYKSSNFALAFLGLPGDQKKAMAAVYSYCRVVDDIVDESPSLQQAEKDLGHWKSALANWPDLGLVLPVQSSLDLEWAIKNFPILKSDIQWIFEGVESDLHPTHYRTLEELLVYCDGVASAVGFCCMSIFGVDRTQAQNYVHATGRALQLTNILRDIASDAKRGRIYIPQNFLDIAGVTQEDIFASNYDDKFLKMVEAFSKVIRDFYATSEREAQKLPLKKIWPAEVMRKTYFEIFKKIQEKQFRVFDEKIKVGKLKKAWIALSQPRA